MRSTDQPQTIVQINIYRLRNGQYEYLLLKPRGQHNDFWRPVTQKVPGHSTIADTVRQAAQEQIGVRGFKHLSREMYNYEWYAGGQRGRGLVFAAELSANAVIEPDHSQYASFAWFPYRQALQNLEWDGNKHALKELDQHLMDRLAANPELAADSWAAGNGQPPHPHGSVPAGNHPADGHGPYGSKVPKRLPDPPAEKPPAYYYDGRGTSVWPL